jgi:hypothetical protein
MTRTQPKDPAKHSNDVIDGDLMMLEKDAIDSSKASGSVAQKGIRASYGCDFKQQNAVKSIT